MFIEQLSAEEIAIIDEMRKIGVNSHESDFFVGNYALYDDFLRYWEEAKAVRMSKVFGNQLILKKKVNVLAEDDELHDSMNMVISQCEIRELFTDIRIMLAQYQNIDKNIPDRDGHYTSIRDEIRNYLFSTDAMIANKYEGVTLELNMPDGSMYKLVHGCKLMKALGRLAKAIDKTEVFEDLRIKQSQIMNQARLTANLCLSIHPLDYMTASYNCNDWHSCMCWDEGEYRRGVIEMMNSPYVVVAYLESNSNNLEFYINKDLSNAKWNSKRWREFIIVADEGIFGIKGYPYWNRTLEDLSLEWLKELFSEAEGIEYADKISSWTTDSDILDPDAGVSLSVVMSCGSGMYNDFYTGNYYRAIPRKGVCKSLRLNYSGVSECIVCGEEEFFEDPSDLACDCCLEHHTCTNCNEEICYADDIRMFDGREYCTYCFNNLDECSCCGEKMDLNYDDTDGLTFAVGTEATNEIVICDDHSSNPMRKTVCMHCAEEIFYDGVRELDKNFERFSNWWHYLPIIPLSHIKDPEALGITKEDIEKLNYRTKEFLKIKAEKNNKIA